jgi:hypothetical protein
MYGLLTSSFFSISATRRIWTFLNRARCRAAMSWYMASTASARERARNSLTICEGSAEFACLVLNNSRCGYRIASRIGARWRSS